MLTAAVKESYTFLSFRAQHFFGIFKFSNTGFVLGSTRCLLLVAPAYMCIT